MFPCSSCSKSFATKKLLRDHQKIHTGKVVCPTCAKTYANLHSLKSHQRRFHPEALSTQAVDNDKGLLVCDICITRFRNRNDLRLHYEKIHGQTFDLQIKKFDTNAEFEAWKQSFVSARYVKRKTITNADGSQTVNYACIRSLERTGPPLSKPTTCPRAFDLLQDPADPIMDELPKKSSKRGRKPLKFDFKCFSFMNKKVDPSGQITVHFQPKHTYNHDERQDEIMIMRLSDKKKKLGHAHETIEAELVKMTSITNGIQFKLQQCRNESIKCEEEEAQVIDALQTAVIAFERIHNDLDAKWPQYFAPDPNLDPNVIGQDKIEC